MNAMMIASAMALQPHHSSFLSAHHTEEPAEVMNPNMSFSPVSTTMQCTISLTLQFLAIYTALGIARTVCELKGEDASKSKVVKSLKAASETVFFAPMVCCMFVGFRMRVLQLSKGTDNPPDWVRYSMQAVSYSILTTTLLVIIIPVFVPESKELHNDKGEIKADAKPFENWALAYTFTGIRYLTFLGVYVGFGAVITGVFMYEPPAGTWEGETPPLSPAVSCTVQLSTIFFLVFFLHAVSRTYTQFAGGAGQSAFENTMERAADTMSMAPMLCVLFLGARMRALQMDPVNGNPQKWAQNCFYACTYAITFQAALAVFATYGLGAKVNKSTDKTIEGDMTIELSADQKKGYTSKALTVVRWIVMISIYVGATAIVCSVFTIEHPDGKEQTPPVSPTMQCVLNLAFQYFFVHLLLWIYFTMEDFEFSKATWMVSAKNAVESAKSTVQFAPMLCILFIATRMRALQITSNEGGPQGWVQDGMYLASWSILIQFWMCLIMPFFVDGYKPDTLDAPAEQKEVSNKYVGYLVTVVRYLALVCLIGGVATVITGVFMMTPETATGKGSNVPAPLGVNDVPGADTAMEATGSVAGGAVDIAAIPGEVAGDAAGDAATAVTG